MLTESIVKERSRIFRGETKLSESLSGAKKSQETEKSKGYYEELAWHQKLLQHVLYHQV